MNGDMRDDEGADITMTWGAETECSKWFYRTAFCTGAVCVSGSPTQWEQDTFPLYDGKTTAISEANGRTPGRF